MKLKTQIVPPVVGDVIYVQHLPANVRLLEMRRITKVTPSGRLRITGSNKQWTLIGDGIYAPLGDGLRKPTAHLPTPELNAKYETQHTLTRFKSVSEQALLMSKKQPIPPGLLKAIATATSTLLHAFPTYEQAVGRAKRLGQNNHARTLEL